MKKLVAAMFLSLSCCAVAADMVTKRKKGYAKDATTGTLIYIEEHERQIEAGRTLSQIIRYRDPQGEVFAQKHLDFRENYRRPLFSLVDERREYSEGLRIKDTTLEVFCTEPGSAEATALKPGLDFVADAGFDRIIETDWDTLVSGKALKFDFLVPSRQGVVKFRVKKTDELEMLGEPAVEFTMAPANALVRWLVDPIVVVYDKKERALLNYQGISNLRGADLKNYDVVISFPPEEREAQQAAHMPDKSE